MGNMNSGSGDGSGSGSGDGSGSGSGNGDGSGDGWGSGYGYGDGSEEARKKIELNILKNIPKEALLLYMHIWEFEETKTKFLNLLKGES